MDETQATVDMSKRVLRGMTWSGWLYNKFSTAPQLAHDPSGSKEIAMGFICPDCRVQFESPELLGQHYASEHESVPPPDRFHPPFRPNSGHVRQFQTQKPSQPTSVGDIHDQFLRDLEPQLAELKEASLALSSSLDTQNAQLDTLDSKIGRVHHDMKRVGIQANQLAGKKVPVVFRFRCAFQELQSKTFLRDVNGEATLGADVVVEGCTFRAYTLGDDSDVWGFQSEKSSRFLGINRFGNLKIHGADFNSYEQFLLEAKPSTPLFCLASYFGLGGWIVAKGDANQSLTIIRGTTENKSQATRFRIVNLEAGLSNEEE